MKILSEGNGESLEEMKILSIGNRENGESLEEVKILSKRNRENGESLEEVKILSKGNRENGESLEEVKIFSKGNGESLKKVKMLSKGNGESLEEMSEGGGDVAGAESSVSEEDAERKAGDLEREMVVSEEGSEESSGSASEIDGERVVCDGADSDAFDGAAGDCVTTVVGLGDEASETRLDVDSLMNMGESGARSGRSGSSSSCLADEDGKEEDCEDGKEEDCEDGKFSREEMMGDLGEGVLVEDNSKENGVVSVAETLEALEALEALDNAVVVVGGESGEDGCVSSKMCELGCEVGELSVGSSSGSPRMSPDAEAKLISRTVYKVLEKAQEIVAAEYKLCRPLVSVDKKQSPDRQIEQQKKA